MSLRQKLIIPLLIISLLMGGFLYAFWIPRSLSAAEATHLQLVERHLDSVVEGLIPLLLANQLDDIHENLGVLGEKNREWISIRLYNAQGTQLYPLLSAKPSPEPGADSELYTIEKKLAYIGTNLGKLLVQVDLAPSLVSDREYHRLLTLMLLGIVLFLTAAISLLLEFAVIRPAQRLAEAARELAQRNFDVPLPAGSNDEMGALVASFAAMREDLRHYQNDLLHEIAERKHTEEYLALKSEELASSNADLQQFAYIASHDLLEPLRMVASYVQLLARRNRDKLDQDSLDFIGYAVEGSTRMQRLINDLLNYSLVGIDTTDLKPVDFNVLFAEVLSNLHLLIEENHAGISHDPLPTLPAIGSQISQLLQNLISNAIKFHGASPPAVHVGARREGNFWVFSVSDNGIGIEPAYFEKIFLIFKRLHSREKYPGTGIGLAICKRVVERHHGRIWVESTPGQGTTFHFSLPADPLAQNDHAEDKPNGTPSRDH